MPCMGPDVNSEEVDRAYEEIMTLLRTKYQLQGRYPSIFCGWMAGHFDIQREEKNNEFKKALRELFLLDACECF